MRKFLIGGLLAASMTHFLCAADPAKPENPVPQEKEAKKKKPKKKSEAKKKKPKKKSEAVAMPAMAPASAPLQEINLLKNGLKDWFFDRKGIQIEQVAKMEDGILKLSGKPAGSLISRTSYKNYEIEVEWRWPGKPGNGGVLPHVGEANQIGVWPRSMEVQILNKHEAEFLAIPRKLPFVAKPGPQKRGVAKRAPKASAKPLGEWNNMRIQCRGNSFKVWLNGVLANECSGWPDSEGPFALQNEGTPYEYRKVVVRPLPVAAPLKKESK